MNCDEDRSIEKAKETMDEVLQPLFDHNAKIRDHLQSQQAKNKPELDPERNREVNPEAVRESFKEAELDPIAETEPEEGETAA